MIKSIKVKRKKYYLLLEKESRRQYGVFPRDAIGHQAAKKYKIKLEKETGDRFVIK